ncbi:MAG: ABC transporter ATP-binding protein [Thermoguttaceae bacterium]
MSNFGRALRLSLRYRWTFLGSILSALVVGVLWGANIGALYPFVEIAFEDRSLQEWVDAEIAAAQAKLAALQEELAARLPQSADAPPTEHPRPQAEIEILQARAAAEKKALARYRFLKPYIDQYVPHSPFETLAWLIGILLVATLVKNLFVMANTVLTARLAYLGTFELQKRFFARTLRMDVETFTSEGTSDLMSRFTYDMQNLAVGLNVLVGKLVREPLKMIACLVGAAVVCWRLLVFSLIVAPVAVWLIQWLARAVKRANRRAMEEMAQLYGRLAETFQAIRIVKAFTMERHERRRFHRVSKEYFRKSMKIARYDSLTRPTIEIMGVLIICLAILAGAYLVLDSQTHLLGIRMSSRPLTWASLVVFYAMLIGAADPARKLSDVFTQLQAGAAAADRIYAMLDRQPQVRDPKDPQPLRRHSRELTFEEVHFAYQPGHPVLRGIDLRICFGQTVAIVGPSGCGKSTLAALIPRFADPTAGVIRLDGIPLTAVRLRDLRSQIGLVTQEPVLFDDTVMNNIRYGSPNASDQEVIEAARRACAHQFIETELPDGYQTLVGPMGGQLSGGQKQRIALARAILRDPAILILDEATSQIDLQSENLIQMALEQFIRGRTVLMITHRLSALRLADRIVVMHEGRILDTGTHEELLARCPFYHRLYQIRIEDFRQSA